MFERISIDADVCHGQPCVKGTRIPVYLLVRMMANGETVESLLQEYPGLAREDVLACLEYASFAVEAQAPASVEEAAKSYEVVDLRP